MAQAAAQAEGFRNVFRGAERARAATGSAFAAALEDDFNTPEALAVMHEWRDHELLPRARSRSSGSTRSPSATRRRREVVELAERRVAARAARDFEAADALRDEIEAAGWEMRDEPAAATRSSAKR